MKTILERSRLRPKSTDIYTKSCQVIPSGVNSPVRAFKTLLQTPMVVSSGLGSKVADVDGHEYLDYCGSWGALIHGHAHPKIVEAAIRRISLGSSFGITTEIEAKLAQKVIDLMPSIEKIRFVSSGTEATMSAVRLARGFTKRDLIVKFSGHYHGHADSFLVQAGSGVTQLSASSSLGVPKEFINHTLCIPYNDFEACQNVFKEWGSRIACVILEPIAANMGVVCPKPGFLQMLREETLKINSLLIFDEVITGFRVSLGGAQELYDLVPDLTCLGKIVGGGFPAAAFGGKTEIMDYLAPKGEVYQAGTLSGNPVAMEAGLASLTLCETPYFYENLEAKTREFIEPIRSWIEKRDLNMCIHQIGSMFTIFFGKRIIREFEDVKKCDLDIFGNFFISLFEKGVYFSPSQFEANFISTAHTNENIEFTKNVILETLEEIF